MRMIVSAVELAVGCKEEKAMEKVSGIGGVFFKARDGAVMRQLGVIPVEPGGFDE